MSEEITARLEHAVQAAREAGAFALSHFRSDTLAVDRKDDGSPVTIADRGAERIMRQSIRAAFPEDGVLGEEEGEDVGSSRFQWILDPVDGTRSFTRGVPLWGTMVAVTERDDPVIGVINCAAAREIVWAGRGLGAFWSCDDGPPQPARVSTRSLAEGLSSTTSPRFLMERTSPETLARTLGASASTRGWSDCYQHLLVATGRIEAAIDPGTEVWDNAPLCPIVEEAGGRFTDFTGERTIRGDGALSTNGAVHDELLEILRG